MSFVTFVRDYIQDPDRIVHIPSFIFDACKEFFLYIFSFQWFRNLTYVSLSFPNDEQNSTSNLFSTVGISSKSLYSQSANQIENLLYDNSWINTFFECKAEQLSFVHNCFYGFFNGFSSTFHFCAVTILIIHILLNEGKNRAFGIALASCFGDISCMIAVLFGFTGLVIPWLAFEPLSYVLGFSIQFFFALEIIKDNRRIKANSDKVLRSAIQFDRKRSTYGAASLPQLASGARQTNLSEQGQLSFNRWLVPLLILFSWCEQTQFFQSTGVFSLQPTATLLEIPGLQSPFNRELQILIYLFSFIATRILITWFCLSIFQILINWKDNTTFNLSNLLQGLPKTVKSYNLLTNDGRQKTITYIKDNFLKVWLYIISFFYNVKSWFIPKSLQNKNRFTFSFTQKEDNVAIAEFGNTQSNEIYVVNNQKGKKIQHFLRDPLAIAAVTCSLAFLPAYSTNLLVTKSIGFFPEENRIKHSLFSPWDMPATVLASDMDFITNHPNLAEYPFFLPFYDRGEYGGWLGVGEEDIRYGPFRLWQSRRIRAPWRRTTLQEPALTFANDKSLFINPLLRTPNLKNSPRFLQNEQSNARPQATSLAKLSSKSFMGDEGEAFKANYEKANKGQLPSVHRAKPNNLFQETANIKSGAVVEPVTSFISQFTPTIGDAKHRNSFLFQHSTSINLSPQNSSSSSFIDSSLPVKRVASLNGKKNGEKLTFSTNGLDYLWKQLKTQSAYTKLLVINSIKPYKTQYGSIAGVLEPQENNSLAFIIDQPRSKQSTIKSITLENSKITKIGRKKIVEVLKKPLRKIKTSTFHFDGDSYVTGVTARIATEGSRLSKNGTVSSYSFGGELLNLKTLGGVINQKVLGLDNTKFINQEAQIKDNKQIRKRFKKFKKKLRLFRTRAYKKRNTKIKRLKHFHYIRNKNKKRRKSRRLIYKLRREYPYIRNIKERKADIFGLYSSTQESKDNNKVAPSKMRSVVNSDTKIKDQNKISSKINFKEKSFYSTEYPKRRNFINVKKDFNLIFRTQIGERLDFAQEEIRARIFMNPYVRFLLNKRIDNFVSPSNKVTSSQIKLKNTNRIQSTVFGSDNERHNLSLVTTPSQVNVLLPSVGSRAVSTQQLQKIQKEDKESKSKGLKEKSSILKETDLFKRRLIISKYVDAVNFLKPNLHHSYVNRVYNHQFKGTLSTARRLFSLKVQYDQPLVQSLNYKSAIEHEGLSLMPRTSENKNDPQSTNGSIFESKSLHHSDAVAPHLKVTNQDSNQEGQSGSLLGMRNKINNYEKAGLVSEARQTNEKILVSPERTTTQSLRTQGQINSGDYKASNAEKHNKIISNKINEQNLELQTKFLNFLEKGHSTPLYAAWDPQLRKLILTNRYLNHRTVTTLAEYAHPTLLNNSKIGKTSIASTQRVPMIQGASSIVSKKQPKVSKQKLDDKIENKSKNNDLIQFTNWPLKESYFKDNEFLVSQLYSNSQPIDSFLSQENEKARPVALPRRVNSFNTVLNYKNNVQPTNAQRSQQFLKLESNDKKTFLFKHSWNSANTATGLIPSLSLKLGESDKTEQLLPPETRNLGVESKIQRDSFTTKLSGSNIQVPTSAEQRKTNRMEEREYPLWMVLKVLPPNQGGFLWPGD